MTGAETYSLRVGSSVPEVDTPIEASYIHLDTQITQIRIVCMVIAYLDIYGLLVRTIFMDGRHFVKEFIYNDILIIFGYELDFYYY